MESIDRRTALKYAAMAAFAPAAAWLAACSQEPAPAPAPEPVPEPEGDDAPAPDTPAVAYTIDNIRDYVVGVDQEVELEEGGKKVAICFDNAATTPAFKPVLDEVTAQLAMYGSIGRGFAQKSDHSTEAYEMTRDKVLEFVGANTTDYICAFANSATDGLNKLASALIDHEGMVVLTTRAEHHSNDLPWRHLCKVIYADVDELGRIKYDEIEQLLSENKVDIVSITAASNVTGYVTDVHYVAKLAHAHGAKIVVDGAQIVAHRKFSMIGDTPDENIDYFAFSAHKMYTPFGMGAVVGPLDDMVNRMPKFYGGGTVNIVADDWEMYKQAPASFEAGSPNYLGVVGLGKAIEVLQEVGFDAIEEHEHALTRRLLDGLSKVDNIIIYGDPTDATDRVGVVTFNFPDINTFVIAQRLARSYAIATRRGAFCAHPYVWRLMGIPAEDLKTFADCTDVNTPGMVRLSLGIYNTEEEIDEFLSIFPEALEMTREDMKHFMKIVPEY